MLDCIDSVYGPANLPFGFVAGTEGRDLRGLSLC